jgi:hypothetical protein
LAQPGGSEAASFLSDRCALSEQNGWGPVERDSSNGEDAPADGGPISIANVVYGKGLGTHAPSDVVFALAGACTRFTAQVGIDDEMKGSGSVRFQVWGDAELLAETGLITGADAAQALDVDLTGMQELRLVVEPDAGNGSDHADWAEARVVCSDAPAPCGPARPAPISYAGYRLAWADEFEVEGPPDPASWSFESGFVRNEEARPGV